MPQLPPGATAGCARCGCTLARRPSGPRDLTLALSFAAAITFLVAVASPLIDLSVVGRTASTTIAGAAYEMWMQDERITGAIVAFCAVIAPAGYLLCTLILLFAARRPPAPKWAGEMLRWMHHFNMWSMLEVMTLGILVALIKISELATVEAGIGLFAVGALVVLFPAIVLTFDVGAFWRTVEWVSGEMPRPAQDGAPVADVPR
jgi:paraquat-inducible protein A